MSKPRANGASRCHHHYTEDFKIGPQNERWFRCMFCGDTKQGHALRRHRDDRKN